MPYDAAQLRRDKLEYRLCLFASRACTPHGVGHSHCPALNGKSRMITRIALRSWIRQSLKQKGSRWLSRGLTFIAIVASDNLDETNSAKKICWHTSCFSHRQRVLDLYVTINAKSHVLNVATSAAIYCPTYLESIMFSYMPIPNKRGKECRM